MKKYIVILFTILSINTQAQKAQLYDANYDKPNLPPIYEKILVRRL